MKRASITEAKNGLSALIDRVRRGESVIIEDRGVPVAQLNPVVGPGLVGDDRVSRLIRLGIVRPPRSTNIKQVLALGPLRTKRSTSLSDAVIKERAEGW